MGWELDIKQIDRNHFPLGQVFAVKTWALVLASMLFNAYFLAPLADGKQQSYETKKKTGLTVTDMSDTFANESVRSSESDVYQTTVDDYDHNYDQRYDNRYDSHYDHYDDDSNHNRFRRYKPISPTSVKRVPGEPHRRKSQPGSMFVPVAAYSVTKTKTKKPPRSSSTYRKRQGGPIRRNPDLDKQTESAVYGYMQRPEIIEFRGQYFYGARPGEALDGPLTPAASSAEGVRYPPYPLDPTDPLTAQAAHSYPNYYGGGGYGGGGYGGGHGSNKLKGTGLGPGGLLLATLPLILAPMLSYLFTPMVIPITATVAAGRRRKRGVAGEDTLGITDNKLDSIDAKHLNEPSFDAKTQTNPNRNEWLETDRTSDPKYKEAQVVVEYLRKVNFDERATTRAIANYLQCDGMLADEDHCIERLSCEFSDPNNYEAPELDRAVTSIILGHILANEYITDSFKIKLKLAARFGKDNPGKCDTRFKCVKVEPEASHH